MKTIALLGTGIMGAPMTRNLAAAGFTMRVWNRTVSKAEALSGVATVFPTAAEAMSGADAVITMLENGAVVTEVLFGALSAAKAGTLFIDMSSNEPSVARDHADALETKGMRHLDAPVSGGEKGATDATLAIMAGGNPTDFADAKPLFDAMGRATHVGIHGAGQVAKLANQVIVGITIGAVAEALLLAQEGGCDPAAVREALMGGFAKAFADLAADPALARNDHSAYMRWLEIQNPMRRLGTGEDQLP